MTSTKFKQKVMRTVNEMNKSKSSLFRSQFNFITKDSDFEHPKGQSLTVAGESFTVKELLMRSQQGIKDNISPGFYSDNEDDFDQVDYNEAANMDLVEKDQLKADTLESLKKGKKAEPAHDPGDNKAEPEDLRNAKDNKPDNGDGVGVDGEES